jgi:hypothetical protein
VVVVDVAAVGRAGGRGGRGALPDNATAADSARFNFQQAYAALTPLTDASPKADTAKFNKSADSLAAVYKQVRPPLPLPRGTLTQCHDITVYPDAGIAGGACAGMGLLLDIRDVANPKRVGAVADSNFSFWHSATFSNDGSMVLFSDEWGGGGAPYCRAKDPKEWGADAIFRIVDNKMVFQSYYKMPAAQTQLENCVAHNGSLIPIPGRTIMVQAWYQGGLSVFEWSDPAHPHEIAFFDRGPNDSTRAQGGGYWSAYWYNGKIVGSEMQRGLDVFELTPSGADHAERDRRGEVGRVEFPERAGPAKDRLAGDVRALACLHRSARAVEGTVRRTGLRGAQRLERGRECVGCGTS